jgi:hypothetical protein
MDQIFLTTSLKSIGNTFHEWSVHYLTGQTRYYNTNNRSWISLVDNPLSTSMRNNTNAHKHQKNHPLGIDEISQTCDILAQQPGMLGSAYPVYLSRITEFCEKHHISCDMQEPKLQEYCQQSTSKFVEYVDANSIPVCYIQYDQHSFGATWESRSDNAHLHRSIWLPSGATTWDDREMKALSIRPFVDDIDHNITFKSSHQWINCLDWYSLPEDVIVDTIDFLNLKVNNKQMSLWQPIAKTWSDQQNRNLKFFRNLDHIVRCVIENISYPINLTFIQEVIVQHMLIYKYGLNLKTWQLEKFPNNTKDLHVLLEENLHGTELLYN